MLKFTAAVLFGGISKKTVTYNGTQYVLPSKINKEDGHARSMSFLKKLYLRIYIFSVSDATWLFANESSKKYILCETVFGRGWGANCVYRLLGAATETIFGRESLSHCHVLTILTVE